MGKGDETVSKKYTPFKRAKDYAPSKKDIDKMGKVVMGKRYKDSPKGKGGKTNV